MRQAQTAALLLVLLGTGLTACQSGYAAYADGDELWAAHERGKDTCGRTFYKPLVGQRYDPLSRPEGAPDGLVIRQIGGHSPPEDGSDIVYTTDLKPRRLNIYLDDDRTIQGVGCG